MRSNLLEGAQAAITRAIPRNPVRCQLKVPVASISFDDVARSAIQFGAPILEQAKLRGTFYICGAHTGQAFEGQVCHQVGDLIALHHGGHEIGCHTYTHSNVTKLSPQARQDETKANQEFVHSALGDVVLSSFAFPYGGVSLGAKAVCARNFFTCRGVHFGLNQGIVDFRELAAIGIESRSFDLVRIRDLIDRARDTHAWLIFFTHYAGPDPAPF
jgi:peptidoglycan/xylan/chitin deacetylase (PgdA/CDA1 family)